MVMGLSPWMEPFPPSKLNPKPADVFSNLTVKIMSSEAEWRENTVIRCGIQRRGN